MRFTLILLFAVFSNGFSQDFRMGKVSKEELLQKRHPLDTSAVAAVLSNKAQTTFTYTKR